MASIVIEDYIDWCEATSRITARKYSVPYEDAISIGYIALMEAVRSFDVDKYDSKIATLRHNFKSFARKRIIGSILDWCRTSKFVKRRGYEQGYQFTMVYVDAERNAALDLPVELDHDEHMDFHDAMRKVLTEREFKVVSALAVGVRTSEIRRALGISHARVDQIANEAREKIKEYMYA